MNSEIIISNKYINIYKIIKYNITMTQIYIKMVIVGNINYLKKYMIMKLMLSKLKLMIMYI